MKAQHKSVSKISLFIADVDGSLVNEDKVLTPRAQSAVKALNAAGIAFAITSGRPPRGMAMLIEPLALRTPIAGFNGGIFIRPDMTIIEEHVVAPDTARRAVKLILEHRMDVWVYSGNDWFVRDPKPTRITLTYPALECSRHVVFLVTGKEKREIFSRFQRGEQTLPAARVRPTGTLHLFADAAAARDMPR